RKVPQQQRPRGDGARPVADVRRDLGPIQVALGRAGALRQHLYALGRSHGQERRLQEGRAWPQVALPGGSQALRRSRLTVCGCSCEPGRRAIARRPGYHEAIAKTDSPWTVTDAFHYGIGPTIGQAVCSPPTNDNSDTGSVASV